MCFYMVSSFSIYNFVCLFFNSLTRTIRMMRNSLVSWGGWVDSIWPDEEAEQFSVSFLLFAWCKAIGINRFNCVSLSYNVIDQLFYANVIGWSNTLLKLFWFSHGRYCVTRSFCIGFVLTFFSAFDVPVFWPILLFYWLMLFTLTMRRQIMHMIKYRYVPFSLGKQVLLIYLAFWLQLPYVYVSWFLIYALALMILHLVLYFFLQRYDGKRPSSSDATSSEDWGDQIEGTI